MRPRYTGSCGARRSLDTGSVCCTGLVLQELLQGFAKLKAQKQITRHFATLPLLVPDRDDHIHAAELRNRCRGQGVQTGTIDALLAQLCVRYDLMMLATDRDFYHIAPISRPDDSRDDMNDSQIRMLSDIVTWPVGRMIRGGIQLDRLRRCQHDKLIRSPNNVCGPDDGWERLSFVLNGLLAIGTVMVQGALDALINFLFCERVQARTFNFLALLSRKYAKCIANLCYK